MRKVLAATLVTLSAASAAWAQPAALRRPIGSPPGQARRNPDPPPAQVAPAPQEDPMCPTKRAILDQDRRALDSYRSELVGVEAELVAIQRRADELRKRQGDLSNLVRSQEQRVQRTDQAIKTQCTDTESCGRYEQIATDLDNQSSAAERELENVRTDITNNQRELGDLRHKIEPLQREYNEKRCNNLVPGETQQTTIDRCTAIFSDWNRLQADLNRANNRMPDLRSRFEQLMAQLKSLETRGSPVTTFLQQKCTTSQKTVVVRNVTTRRERGATVGQELDKLIDDIKSLRGVQITVTTK